jgi:hypothetical protein
MPSENRFAGNRATRSVTSQPSARDAERPDGLADPGRLLARHPLGLKESHRTVMLSAMALEACEIRRPMRTYLREPAGIWAQGRLDS